MKRRVRWSVIVVAAMLGPGCATAPPSIASPALVAELAPLDRAALERAIHQRVNQLRRRHGRSALAWNDSLRPIARAHSQNMADRNDFAHVLERRDVVERYERAGFRCRVPAGGGRQLTGGENLFLGHRIDRVEVRADGTTRAAHTNNLNALAQSAVEGWMDSPSHRRNLLLRHWETESIGVYVGADGRVWVTQNFC